MSNSANEQLHNLQAALRNFDGNPADIHRFSSQARGNEALLSALPEKFSTVLHNLLDRLESSALFSDESCSFSQRDLLDSMQLWVDKAQDRLSAAS